MATDADILSLIDAEFGGCPRPARFHANPDHCEECAEYEQILRSRDRQTLGMDDVGVDAWDPVAGITPEGFAYYMPAFARLALETATGPIDPRRPAAGWYGPQFFFHLTRDGHRNERATHCTPGQRAAVRRLLEHIFETRADRFDTTFTEAQFFHALNAWQD
jgi:hypothetical protein